MNKVYQDAKDKNVAAIMVYADADDGHLFYDSEKSEKIALADLKDMFLKGMVVSLETDLFIPTTFAEESGAGKVTVFKDSGTAATIYNFYSAEKA